MSSTAIMNTETEAVIEALLERFFWERVDALTRLVWPNKKSREPLQASGFRISVDAEPKAPNKHRAVHISYQGATVSAGVPDALADYMERERPFHRFLGLDGTDV